MFPIKYHLSFYQLFLRFCKGWGSCFDVYSSLRPLEWESVLLPMGLRETQYSFSERLIIQVSLYDCRFWDQMIDTMTGDNFFWICIESSNSLAFPRKRILMTISKTIKSQLCGILSDKIQRGTWRVESMCVETAAHELSWEPRWCILVESLRHKCVCLCMCVCLGMRSVMNYFQQLF